MKCHSSEKEVVPLDFSVGEVIRIGFVEETGIQFELGDDLVLSGRQTSCGEFQVEEIIGHR